MKCAELFETYDPLSTERQKAAFLFMDDKFLAVPYQQHLETLSQLLGIAVPHRNDWHNREKWYDDLNALAAQRGYVQGDYMPGVKGAYSSLITSMMLKGTLPACRKAFAAFKAMYPRQIEQVEWVSLEVIGKDGKRASASDLRGNQIDRRLGRRDS